MLRAMILLVHPTGNTFVRALVQALEARHWLAAFATTLAVNQDTRWLRLLPARLRRQVSRRGYQISPERILRFPTREAARHVANALGLRVLTRHDVGLMSVDAVYRDLDRRAADWLLSQTSQTNGVYGYEDGALYTFRAASKLGLRRFYELPIAYWETSGRLLREEADRLPEWESTLGATRESAAKLDRKTEELDLADTVICPSKFVLDSLPGSCRTRKRCVVAPFGSPAPPAFSNLRPRSRGLPLRVLFAGSMTQRKGLADVFAAMKILNRGDVQLIVLGSLMAKMEFYHRQYPHFWYEPTRSHGEVMELMRSCDVLVLPSIVEGRALVQQEAMSCGLPLIVTANAGGEDLVEEGQTGFLVPIRSPEKIAEKLAWFADHRAELEQMRDAVRTKAQSYTWAHYSDIILDALRFSGASVCPSTASLLPS